MSTVRYRRLQSDHARLLDYVRQHPRVQLVATDGDPPERYQLDYQIRSLRMVNDELMEVDNHLVEIILPGHYPRLPPQCRMLTPIFHPNIAPHAICVGDHWSAGEPLWSLVARIGEMIAYQSYNTKSPLNGEAARWVANNLDQLPLDLVSLMVEEKRESRSDPIREESPRFSPAPAPPPPPASPPPAVDVYPSEPPTADLMSAVPGLVKGAGAAGRQARPLSALPGNHTLARPLGLWSWTSVSSEKPPIRVGRRNTESTRRHHRQMLLIAAAVVVLSFLLEVRADQRVTPRGLVDLPVPQTCSRILSLE